MGNYSKPEKLEVEKVDKVSTVRPPKYRYYCDACSGDAFFSEKREVMVAGECQRCGKPYMTKSENYLPNNR